MQMNCFARADDIAERLDLFEPVRSESGTEMTQCPNASAVDNVTRLGGENTELLAVGGPRVMKLGWFNSQAVMIKYWNCNTEEAKTMLRDEMKSYYCLPRLTKRWSARGSPGGARLVWSGVHLYSCQRSGATTCT